MNKIDFDRYYKKGVTYVIPVEIFNEIFDELERQISNYEQALEDLDKKENIIKEVRKYIEEHSQMTDLQINGIENVLSFRGSVEKLLEILDKENK